MNRAIVSVIAILVLCTTALAGKALTTSQSTEISALADEVWAMLVDPNHWADWNRAVISSRLIEGDGESVGSKVKFLPKIGDRNFGENFGDTILNYSPFFFSGLVLGARVRRF